MESNVHMIRPLSGELTRSLVDIVLNPTKGDLSCLKLLWNFLILDPYFIKNNGNLLKYFLKFCSFVTLTDLFLSGLRLKGRSSQ